MAFTLPDLPYAYDALEPHMSAETLEFHHDKHHNAYVVNGNKLLEDTSLENKSLGEIVKEAWKQNLTGLFNNAAQHWNHIEFWKMMASKANGKIPGKLETKLVADFGSVDAFKQAFCTAGATQFGSGWAWLILNSSGKLEITKTANGENPLVHGGEALLGCDVWEHSYYIDYRNARPKYLEAFVNNLVNWEYVAEKLDNAS